MKIQRLSRAIRQLNDSEMTDGELGPKVLAPSEHARTTCVKLRQPELLHLVEAEVRKKERKRAHKKIE